MSNLKWALGSSFGRQSHIKFANVRDSIRSISNNMTGVIDLKRNIEIINFRYDSPSRRQHDPAALACTQNWNLERKKAIIYHHPLSYRNCTPITGSYFGVPNMISLNVDVIDSSEFSRIPSQTRIAPFLRGSEEVGCYCFRISPSFSLFASSQLVWKLISNPPPFSVHKLNTSRWAPIFITLVFC